MVWGFGPHGFGFEVRTDDTLRRSVFQALALLTRNPELRNPGAPLKVSGFFLGVSGAPGSMNPRPQTQGSMKPCAKHPARTPNP